MDPYINFLLSKFVIDYFVSNSNTTMTAANCTSMGDASEVTKNSVHFDDISVAATSNVVNGSLAPPPRVT